MKNEEVNKVVQLRDHIIKYYNTLEEPTVSTSVMNTKDAAMLCERVIASLDELLEGYVTFQKEDKK